MRILTEPLAILRAHTTEVHALLFVRIRSSRIVASSPFSSSPSVSTTRTFLLSGSIDGTIVVWDTLYFQQLASWYSHSGGVLNLATIPFYTPGTDNSYPENVPIDNHHHHDTTTSYDEYGIFYSQGRDGCIHQWRLDIIENSGNKETLSSSTSTVPDNLSFLDDIIAPTAPSSLSVSSVLPFVIRYTKLQTIRVGFGSFCRMHILSVPQELIHGTTRNIASTLASSSSSSINTVKQRSRTKRELMKEEEEVEDTNDDNQGKDTVSFQLSSSPSSARNCTILIAPSLDAAKLSIWDIGTAGHPAKELCVPITIAPDDAIKVSTTLGRKQPESTESSDTTETSTNILQGLFRQSGMVMCTQLIARPLSLPRSLRNPTNPTVASSEINVSSSSSSLSSTSVLDNYIQEHYRTPDGTILHPDAPSLKELLKQAKASPVPFTNETATVDKFAVLQQYRSSVAVSPFLIIACYENGALYVLDPLLIPAEDHANYSTFIDNYNSNTLPDVPALITLPVSTDPLLTFAFDRNSTQNDDYAYGVVGTSGTILYTVRLDYRLLQGMVLHQINLPTPGCSISVSLPPPPPPMFSSHPSTSRCGFLMGCWDNDVRYIDITKAKDKNKDSLSSSLHTVLQWHRTSIQSVAVMSSVSPPLSDSSEVSNFALVTIASGAKDGRVALWSMDRSQ